MIKNEKLKWINILIWIASIFVMIGIMMYGPRVADDENSSMVIESAALTIIMFIFLYIISGKKTFTFLNNKTIYTIKGLAPMLIFPGIFFVFGVFEVLFENPELISNWKSNVLFGALNMFFVGMYEETCFRACACDALLPVLKKIKHPFFFTALISSFVFGYVHVTETDFSSFIQTLQFVLKLVTTALNGAMLMFAYWKTRNIFALGIIHGLNDLLPYFFFFIFNFPYASDSASYTDGSVGTTVVYFIQLIFEILVFRYVYKKFLKDLDFKKTLEEW